MKTKLFTLLITLFTSISLFAISEPDSMYIHFTASDGSDSIVIHPIAGIDSIVYYAPPEVNEGSGDSEENDSIGNSECDSLDYSSLTYDGDKSISYKTTVSFINPETSRTEYYRYFAGEKITTNLHGDIWIEVAKPELEFLITEELADFLNLELYYSMDTLTHENEDGSLSYITYKELIDMGYTSSFCYELENTYVFKTGIYSLSLSRPGGGSRVHATCEYEFFMFMSRFYNGCNSHGASYNPYPDEF